MFSVDVSRVPLSRDLQFLPSIDGVLNSDFTAMPASDEVEAEISFALKNE